MPILEPSTKVATGAASGSRLSGLLNARLHASDPRWQLAKRIAASDGLSRSRLLQDFLLYIVDRALSNRTDDITEQQIGVLVFGRPEGYDSNEDNIVRSYARNLRRRVDEYFAGEGRDEKLRLTIPRGGYVPIFSDAVIEQESQEKPSDEAAIPSSIPVTEVLPEPASQSSLFSLQMLLVLILGILVGTGACYLTLEKKAVLSPQAALTHRLWSNIFSRDRDTFLVPPDDGIVIMQGMMPRPLSLASYVSGSYRYVASASTMPGHERLMILGTRRFTNVVDLDFVTHLAQLKETVPERMMVRYARDLRMDDLRTGNAILIGADESNPWIELFQSQMPFRFCFDCTSPERKQVISNAHPRPGEQSVYVNSGDGDTYGIIAFLPNLTSTGHVLIVAGLNTAGTQAATTFLLDPASMKATLQRATTSDGKLQSFELLIGADNVATNASTPHVVLERIGEAK